MTRSWVTALLVLGVAVVGAAACGEKDHAGVLPGPGNTGGSTGKGGSSSNPSGGDNGNAGGSEGMPDPEGAPDVTITSPDAATDPNEDDVLTGAEVEVLCTAVQSKDANSEPVDQATVSIELIDSEGGVADTKAGAPTANENEYAATFSIAALPSGTVTFRCSVSDTSSPPLTGTDEVDSFVDHGPTITIGTPAAMSAWRLKGKITFDFTVDPAPLAEDDEEAKVDPKTVTLNVNGKDFDVEQDDDDDSRYLATIDFEDKSLFEDPPSGSIPVIIAAANSRTPEAVTQTLPYEFLIDGDGPVIVVTSHENEDVIGGEVNLKFTVTDELSGVDDGQVVVAINPTDADDGENYDGQPPWSKEGDAFVYQFDSVNVTGSKFQVSINIKAKDSVGNEALAESLTLYLDNQPPIVDLDPLNVRELDPQAGGNKCTKSFDPLGISPHDLTTDATSVQRLRALVWDETNDADGALILYYATVKQDSVRLVLQADPNIPLLTDSDDADDICDNVETGTDVRTLHAIQPAGTAPHGPGEEGEFPAMSLETCTPRSGPETPDKLCSGFSDLSRVIGHSIASKQIVDPTIYGLGSLSGAACTGDQWELATNGIEGWVCLAARAEDLVGNVGVSRPLRLCIDNLDVPGAPDCSVDGAPDCTDGCDLPPSFPTVDEEAFVVDL